MTPARPKRGPVPAESRAPRPNARARASRVVTAIAKAAGAKALPSVSAIARRRRDPFRVLVSTVISLRTKDDVTMEASRRLLGVAATPEKLAATAVRAIERAIYPAGFYKTKARTLKGIARRLLDEYDGVVPRSVDELLTFKGVGRKTATLVASLGYGEHAICVDTHVHRVSNRLGLVDTRTPEETEYALMALLPRRHWIGYNELLVGFGQRTCTPVSPRCSTCPLARSCPKNGVGRRR